MTKDVFLNVTQHNFFLFIAQKNFDFGKKVPLKVLYDFGFRDIILNEDAVDNCDEREINIITETHTFADEPRIGIGKFEIPKNYQHDSLVFKIKYDA